MGIADLIVAGLARRQRREGAALGFQIQERRAVEAVGAADEDIAALDADQATI